MRFNAKVRRCVIAGFISLAASAVPAVAEDFSLDGNKSRFTIADTWLEQRTENETSLPVKSALETASPSSVSGLKIDAVQNSTILTYAALGTLLIILPLLVIIYRQKQAQGRLSTNLAERAIKIEQEANARTSELRQNESRFRALIEFSPVGVYGTDAEGNCNYVNERWCEISGLTREQAFGKGWLRALHPADRKLLYDNWVENPEVEGLFNSEYRYLTPRGEIRWLYGQFNSESDSEGNLLGYVGTVTNITAHKHLEEQLRRSQKMDSLGKLTGGIAHDYNNMLAVISGFADLLQEELSGQPELQTYVKQIMHASDRGANLTKKLLAFTRQSASDATSVDINLLLTDQKQMLETTLTSRIQLILKLQENLWPVLVDGGDLEDAIVNLCINAMHAIDGNGDLTIETENRHLDDGQARILQLEKGDYVLLSVTDTGNGMDDSTKERLFDPFFSTKGPEGTGLGLTQVYGFLERSSGVIKVDSEPEKGTRIELFFPALLNTRDTDITDPESNRSVLKGDEAILIVDDEPALLQLAAEILEQEGYRTVCCTSGRQALEVLEQEPINLLLSDVVMPDMDGYQLAKAAQEKHPDLKIQFTEDFDGQLFDQLLKKPYHPQILLRRMQELLSTNSNQ